MSRPFETRHIEDKGLGFTVELWPDEDSTTDDAECYSPSDIAAWQRDEWSFIGVVVRSDTGDLQESLWSVEYGSCPAETEPFQGGMHEAWTVDTDKIVSEYPVPDLLSELRSRMHKELPALREQVNAAIAATERD
jgi:hypothetical protein